VSPNHAAAMRQSAVNTELFKSTLIAGVLPDCDSTRPRKILDFGEAHASTIAHLQRTFWGRLTVLDLISQAPEINALLSDDEASEQRAAVLEDSFEPCIGQAYDLVLMWDFALYLSDSNLNWLNDWLDAMLTYDGVAHGFVCHNATRGLVAKRWGIVGLDQLEAESGSAELPYRHLRGALSRGLPDFQIDKSVLMKDGRLEFVIRRG
jgi:hypothetical protein